LATAVRHGAAAAEAERARRVVAEFPPEWSAMSGTEHEQLVALRKRIRECSEESERARRGEEDARSTASRLFAGEAPDRAMLVSLRARLEELRELQRVEAECQRTLAASLARQADARRAI